MATRLSLLLAVLHVTLNWMDARRSALGARSTPCGVFNANSRLARTYSRQSAAAR